MPNLTKSSQLLNAYYVLGFNVFTHRQVVLNTIYIYEVVSITLLCWYVMYNIILKIKTEGEPRKCYLILIILKLVY